MSLFEQAGSYFLSEPRGAWTLNLDLVTPNNRRTAPWSCIDSMPNEVCNSTSTC